MRVPRRHQQSVIQGQERLVPEDAPADKEKRQKRQNAEMKSGMRGFTQLAVVATSRTNTR